MHRRGFLTLIGATGAVPLGTRHHAHGGARAAAIRLEFPEPAPEIDWEVEF